MTDFGLYARALSEETMTREQTLVPVQEDIVITVLTDFPDNVAAFACHGQLTKDDYETVLIPHIEEKLARHKKLRAYTEITPDFTGVDPGAYWDDVKFGFSHFFDWERAALVTDVEWMTRATKFFSFLMPGEWRTFPYAEARKAREWIEAVGERPQ